MPIALTCGVGVRAVACVMTETKRLVGILTNKKTLRIGMGDQWEIDETLVDGIGWRDWVEGLGGGIGWREWVEGLGGGIGWTDWVAFRGIGY